MLLFGHLDLICFLYLSYKELKKVELSMQIITAGIWQGLHGIGAEPTSETPSATYLSGSGFFPVKTEKRLYNVLSIERLIWYMKSEFYVCTRSKKGKWWTLL
ncbi:hypothetical protein Dimus_032698 [Dionaea muscipula]